MAKKTTGCNRRRLTFEALETRRVCAGNVTALVENGVLVIRGDEQGNGVHIDQIPVPPGSGPWTGAKYEIKTWNSFSRRPTPASTTINGQTSIIVEGVKNGFDIQLGDGSDGLYISRSQPKPGGGHSAKNAQVSGDIAINMGGGEDKVKLRIENNRKVDVNLGSGWDGVQFYRNTLRTLNVNTDPAATGEQGNDSVYFERLTAKGNISVTTGGGNDIVQGELSAEGNVSIATGSGDDTIQRLLRVDNSSPRFASKVSGTFLLDTGEGNDQVVSFGLPFANIENGQITHFTRPEVGSLQVFLGGGKDMFDTEGIHVHNDMSIQGNSGNDYFRHQSLVVDGIFMLNSGQGDDEVAFVSFKSEFGSGTLDGGDNEDNLLVDSENDLSSLTIVRFEHQT